MNSKPRLDIVYNAVRCRGHDRDETPLSFSEGAADALCRSCAARFRAPPRTGCAGQTHRKNFCPRKPDPLGVGRRRPRAAEPFRPRPAHASLHARKCGISHRKSCAALGWGVRTAVKRSSGHAAQLLISFFRQNLEFIFSRPYRVDSVHTGKRRACRWGGLRLRAAR